MAPPALTARSPSSTSNVTPLGRARAGAPGPLQAKKSLGSLWNWRQKSGPKRPQVGLGTPLGGEWKGEGKGGQTAGLGSKGKGQSLSKGRACLKLSRGPGPSPQAPPSSSLCCLALLLTTTLFLFLLQLITPSITSWLWAALPPTADGTAAKRILEDA